MLETLIAVVVGAAVGFISACGLEVIRENRQRNEDRRRLVGALRAELAAVAQNWLSASKAYRESGGEKPILVGTEPRFPIFDGAGRHLALLPAGLVDEAVRCYTDMKDAYDMSRYVSTNLMPQWFALPQQDQRVAMEQIVRDACERTTKIGDRAAESMREFVKRLETVA